MGNLLTKVLNITYMMILVIVISAIIGLIFAWPVQLLWNWILPDATAGVIKPITVWQAWGLNVMLSILIGRNVVPSK